MKINWIGFILFGAFLTLSGLIKLSNAQEVKHPDMELTENENGEQVVVVITTQNPPDPKLYVVKEEEAGDKKVFSVIYKPTGETISFFTTTTVKGKVEGPGVSISNRRVAPEIEKVVGQKSYDKELKRRYLELVFPDKGEFLFTDQLNQKEIDDIIKKSRN